MLPHLTKTLTATATAAALVLASLQASPANAWGKSEQDVLTGVLGTLAIQALIRHDEAHRKAPAVVQPQPLPQPIYAPQPVSIHRTPLARAFNSYSRAERETIQRQLRAAGYYRGGADGVFGPGTYSALVGYASDRGMSGQLASTGGAFGVMDGLIY